MQYLLLPPGKTTKKLQLFQIEMTYVEDVKKIEVEKS